LVTDLQGVNGYLLTDPCLHTPGTEGMSSGDLGIKGIINFFSQHECNEICLALRLERPPLNVIPIAENAMVWKEKPIDPDATLKCKCDAFVCNNEISAKAKWCDFCSKFLKTDQEFKCEKCNQFKKCYPLVLYMYGYPIPKICDTCNEPAEIKSDTSDDEEIKETNPTRKDKTTKMDSYVNNFLTVHTRKMQTTNLVSQLLNANTGCGGGFFNVANQINNPQAFLKNLQSFFEKGGKSVLLQSRLDSCNDIVYMANSLKTLVANLFSIMVIGYDYISFDLSQGGTKPFMMMKLIIFSGNPFEELSNGTLKIPLPRGASYKITKENLDYSQLNLGKNGLIQNNLSSGKNHSRSSSKNKY
jgi:hypothetical protein